MLHLLQDGKGTNRDGSQVSVRRIAPGDGYRKPPKADESRGIDRGIGKEVSGESSVNSVAYAPRSVSTLSAN